jgi:glycosyltransferase involved in cell wall biosynthesis
VEALAAALDELLAKPEVRAAMGEQGRRYVRAQLSWERVAVAIAEMYRACLAARPSF